MIEKAPQEQTRPATRLAAGAGADYREAAKEAARQIRLRNLSGIIMIDFIDMKSKDDEKELLQVMQHYLNGDSKKAVAVDITKLGIMEITRKKEKNPIFRQISIDILK